MHGFSNPSLSDLTEIRQEKAKELQDLGQEPYAVRFQVTHQASSLQIEHQDLPNGQADRAMKEIYLYASSQSDKSSVYYKLY